MNKLSSSFRCLVVLLALSIIGASQSAHSYEKKEHFTDRTDSATFEFDTKADMQKARLRVKAQISSGSARWELIDPRGEVRITAQSEKGLVSADTGEIEAIAGIWKLKVELQNASGAYVVTWKAQ